MPFHGFQPEQENAVKCSTEEEARTLFNFLIDLGFHWASGDYLNIDNTRWCQYKNATAYYFFLNEKRLVFGDNSCLRYGTNVFETPDDFISEYLSQACEPISLDIGDVL